MKTLSVIIPSRTCLMQVQYLTRALESIRAQTQAAILASPIIDIEIIVAVDEGSRIPAVFEAPYPEVQFVHDLSRCQAGALNTGVKESSGDYIAFLEDDDTWHPQRLEITLPYLEGAADEVDFVSSTQLEVDFAGNVIRINDFPTPSGWIMPRSTWDAVGPFNEQFRFHLDNEWLGRLGRKEINRVHCVESTAPDQIEHCFQVRPWLASVLQNGRGVLKRHHLPTPLITRSVHPGSGMDRIATDPNCAQQSRNELQLLQRRFHRIPW